MQPYQKNTQCEKAKNLNEKNRDNENELKIKT